MELLDCQKHHIDTGIRKSKPDLLERAVSYFWFSELAIELCNAFPFLILKAKGTINFGSIDDHNKHIQKVKSPKS